MKYLSLSLFLVFFVALRGEDTPSRLDPALLDPQYPLYPQMIEWAKAGVEGGIPRDLKVVAHARPDADLQQLIDRAPETGGVILLSPGYFILAAPLKMRTRVVLRGADSTQTHLVIKLRAPKGATPDTEGKSTMIAGIQFADTTLAGLESLEVIFDPALPPPPTMGDSDDGLRDNPNDLGDLHVMSVHFTGASNCWMNNCKITNSGSHPLFIETSHHIGLSYVEIKGAQNRGLDSGMIKVRRSSYVLFNTVTVYDINQIVMSNGTPDQPCRFNVMEKCRFNVDVRFRAEWSGGNLMEDCLVTIPGIHERPALSQDRAGANPSGWDSRNFIYNCTITRDFPAANRVLSMADDPQKVYTLSDNIRETVVAVVGDAPAKGVLWPVR